MSENKKAKEDIAMSTFKTREKKWLVITFVTIVGIVIGCSQLITSNEKTDSVESSYKRTIHETIMLHYFNNHDVVQLKEKMALLNYEAVQLHALSSTRGDNTPFEDILTEIIITNLRSLIDEGLIEEAIMLASSEVIHENLLDFEHADIETFILYAKEQFDNLEKNFFDYKNEFGGYNYLKFTREGLFEEGLRFYANEVEPLLSFEENKLLKSLINKIHLETPVDELIEFVNHSMNNTDFTEKYQEMIDFTLNLLMFYNSDDINTDSSGGTTSQAAAIVVLDALGGFAGAYSTGKVWKGLLSAAATSFCPLYMGLVIDIIIML